MPPGLGAGPLAVLGAGGGSTLPAAAAVPQWGRVKGCCISGCIGGCVLVRHCSGILLVLETALNDLSLHQQQCWLRVLVLQCSCILLVLELVLDYFGLHLCPEQHWCPSNRQSGQFATATWRSQAFWCHYILLSSKQQSIHLKCIYIFRAHDNNNESGGISLVGLLV